MKNIINAYTAVMQDKDITAVVDVEETLNIASGDVDENMSVKFYNKNLMDIGYAKVSVRGDHRYVNGDYNGKSLLHRFNLESI